MSAGLMIDVKGTGVVLINRHKTDACDADNLY